MEDIKEKRSGRPKENHTWKGYGEMTKAEKEIIIEIEKSGRKGLKIRDLTRLTNYHPVSVSHMLNHLASRNLIVKNLYGYWRIKNELKERITIEVSENFREDLEIKAIKEGMKIEDYIIKKLEQVIF